MINQDNHRVAFFSEKLKKTIRHYNVYDREFCSMVQRLRLWHHYLLPKEFILYSNHQALHDINFKKEYRTDMLSGLNLFRSICLHSKHYSDVDNKTSDILSRKFCTLRPLSAKVIAFECLVQEYHTC